VKRFNHNSEALFQSTRPRGARPHWLGIFSFFSVSIHAPAGGATQMSQHLDAGISFNPRARGGRDLFQHKLQFVIWFQSTRPRGARQNDNAVVFFAVVSIHAPAGGATVFGNMPISRKCFNPRARGGRDPMQWALLAKSQFQSTRPRGARPSPTKIAPITVVSIHAPAGGATSSVKTSPSI